MAFGYWCRLIMPEEKLEFLKRKEVRTMKKDLSRLREQEAKKERERIIRLEMEKKAKTKEEKQKIDLIPKKKPFSLKLLPKIHLPTKCQKVIVRIFIVILLILISAFIFTFWHWYIREGQEQPVSPPTPLESLPVIPEETIPPIEEKPVEQEIIIPLSLISVDATTTLTISNKEELIDAISQLVQEEQKESEIQRIIIKDIKKNKILGIREFFETFEVKEPENFLNNLENDFTLFVYSQKQGNRFGFVAKIKTKEKLTDLLKVWEPTMEKDYQKLFEILGKDKRALIPYFKQASYKGKNFRYQTFSQNGLGICYLVSENYFIFTSSGESIMEIISRL